MDTLRPRCLVELGTHHGFSYFVFCQAVRRLRLDTVSFAVDTWRGEEHSGHYGEEVFAAVSAQNRLYASFSTLLRGTFNDALQYFGQGQVDLLHIDGRHRYEDVKDDFESWKDRLTDDAVVLFHDTNARERDFGVWRYFSELKALHPSFEFVHGHGLGVLCPGKRVPEALQTLMDGDVEVARSTRLAYAALGDAIAERRHFQSVRAGIEALHRPDADLTLEAMAALPEGIGGDPTLVHVRDARAIERDAAGAARAELDRLARALDAARAAEGATRRSLADAAKAERARAEAAVASARGARAEAEAEAARSRHHIDLLRRLLLGRNRTIARLAEAERRSQAIAGVNDGLRRLLVEERLSPRHRQLRDLIAVRRGQAASLRRSIAEERRARLQVEERLTAIERSRAWRLLAKLRSIAGRSRSPIHSSPLTGLGAEDLALLGAVEGTGLFDPAFYAERNPDIPDAVSPALHFARSGWREGRRPNPDFDPAAYLARHPAVAAQDINPLVHLADHGIDEGFAALSNGGAADTGGFVAPGLTEGQNAEVELIRASFLFDPHFYGAENPDIAAEGADPAAHYVVTGWRELRDPSADFDTAFYLAQNPDVASSGQNPLVHFIEVGQEEGRLPRAGAPQAAAGSFSKAELAPDDLAAAEAVIATGLFDVAFYRSTYADVSTDGRHPAAHFAIDGWREKRDPSPAFDTGHYLRRNEDVVRSGENPLVHYARVGAMEGREPVPDLGIGGDAPDQDARLAREIAETGLFDEPFYRAQNPDIVERKLDPVLHFATLGWREGRSPRPDFDPNFYLEEYPDVAFLGVNPLLHYARHGIVEGRRPSAAPAPFTHLGQDYARWVEMHDTVVDDDRRAIRARLARLSYRPLISVVMPVYNTEIDLLRDAIASVQAQLYPHWELCIADDASTDARVPALLREFCEADPRIKLVVRERNGHISASSNSALELAEGEFVALMDHDDILPEHALFTVVAYLNDDPDVDLIFSDEDHIDRNGIRFMPYFKSDYNPELMLGHNMVSHLGVYRRTILDEIGGFRLGYEGSQDYDLALRFVDAIDPRRILHIPHVLYHWRSFTGEATFSQSFADRCIASARKAIADHLARTGQRGTVVGHPVVSSFQRVTRTRPHPAPLVSVIVPTKDRVEILRPCCEGVLHRTDYPHIELIVVDHESSDPATADYLSQLARDARVKIVPYEGPFNYSSINNAAVRRAEGQILAFLNNDVEVIGSDWLDEMVALACRPEIGAVGAKLLYADGRVQHGGVVLGTGGVAGHGFHLIGRDDPGDMGRAVLTMAVSAVTAACLVLRREVFEAVGGFDEANLAVTFNDIDLCLKVRASGLRNVLAAQAVLYHHESLSRGKDSTPEKVARAAQEARFMMEKWGDELQSDPLYNPNLDLMSSTYSLAHPPRRKLPWSAKA